MNIIVIMTDINKDKGYHHDQTPNENIVHCNIQEWQQYRIHTHLLRVIHIQTQTNKQTQLDLHIMLNLCPVP